MTSPFFLGTGNVQIAPDAGSLMRGMAARDESLQQIGQNIGTGLGTVAQTAYGGVEGALNPDTFGQGTSALSGAFQGMQAANEPGGWKKKVQLNKALDSFYNYLKPANEEQPHPLGDENRWKTAGVDTKAAEMAGWMQSQQQKQNQLAMDQIAQHMAAQKQQMDQSAKLFPIQLAGASQDNKLKMDEAMARIADWQSQAKEREAFGNYRTQLANQDAAVGTAINRYGTGNLSGIPQELIDYTSQTGSVPSVLSPELMDKIVNAQQREERLKYALQTPGLGGRGAVQLLDALQKMDEQGDNNLATNITDIPGSNSMAVTRGKMLLTVPKTTTPPNAQTIRDENGNVVGRTVWNGRQWTSQLDKSTSNPGEGPIYSKDGKFYWSRSKQDWVPLNSKEMKTGLTFPQPTVQTNVPGQVKGPFSIKSANGKATYTVTPR